MVATAPGRSMPTLSGRDCGGTSLGMLSALTSATMQAGGLGEAGSAAASPPRMRPFALELAPHGFLPAPRC